MHRVVPLERLMEKLMLQEVVMVAEGDLERELVTALRMVEV